MLFIGIAKIIFYCWHIESLANDRLLKELKRVRLFAKININSILKFMSSYLLFLLHYESNFVR